MAEFSPVEALQKKYGPLPGYVWLGAIAIVGFFFIKSQQAKSFADEGEAGEDPGEFESSVRTRDPETGTETSYSAKGPNSGFLGLVGQPLAGPMPSSMGDVYVNLPGGETAGKQYQTYKVPSKDMGLHQISDLIFGTDQHWRDIYRLNAEVIGNNPWRDLTGLVLRIPEGLTTTFDDPKPHSSIPKWADVGGKQAEKDLYKKYDYGRKRHPEHLKLAEILEAWSHENMSKNKSLAIQQRDWAAKIRAGKQT